MTFFPTQSAWRSLLLVPAPLALLASGATPAAELPDPAVSAAPAAVEAAVSLPQPVGEELGQGRASYYGRELSGRRTANGERFDPAQLTAAHPTLPFGSHVVVTSLDTGRSVVVRINDRGPFGGGRMIDISQAAAREIGLVARGTGQVSLKLLPGGPGPR